MKTIYIRKPEPRSKTRLYIIGFIVLFLVSLRAMSPLLVENMINHAGSDEKGYTFRVDDIDLKIWKGEMTIGDVKVYNEKTDQNFVLARDVELSFDPTKIFNNKKAFSVSGKEVDITLSKDLFSEVERVKNQSKNKSKNDLYLSKVEADIDTINIQQSEKGGTRTLITLKDTEADLRDIGVGSINENTKFEVKSKIAGGGNIHLEGKTKPEAQKVPWVIEGKMEEISSAVIEKLAGDKLPFEIEKANISADIKAHSDGSQVTGVLAPHIKDFKLADDKDQSFIKRNLAKLSNYVLERSKGKNDELNMNLPFTLNENFTLNLPETIEQVVK